MEEFTDKRSVLKKIGFSDEYLDALEEYEKNHYVPALELPKYESIKTKPDFITDMQFDYIHKNLTHFTVNVKESNLFYLNNPADNDNE